MSFVVLSATLIPFSYSVFFCQATEKLTFVIYRGLVRISCRRADEQFVHQVFLLVSSGLQTLQDRLLLQRAHLQILLQSNRSAIGTETTIFILRSKRLQTSLFRKSGPPFMSETFFHEYNCFKESADIHAAPLTPLN